MLFLLIHFCIYSAGPIIFDLDSQGRIVDGDALALEEIKKHETYLGKRIKRGLFQSSIGKRINADVNGSLNILRKVAGNVFLSSRGFVVNPVKISCGFTKSLVEFL